MARPDGRRPDEIRPIILERGFHRGALGSALFSLGKTRVLCTAAVEDAVPPWLEETGKGWLSAEYEMHPCATTARKPREGRQGEVGGRTKEIQRIIGRAMRAVVDLEALGPRTIWLDCEVLEADGGTRTAAISGSYVALEEAILRLLAEGRLAASPIRRSVQAISVGIVKGEPRLDLAYEEDALAQVDMNVAMTGDGALIEVQGTAEREPFTEAQLATLLGLARKGCAEVRRVQEEAGEDR